MKAKIEIEKYDSAHGHDLWDIFVNGIMVGELHRDKPMRWHANGVSGQVVDMDAPWEWEAIPWSKRDSYGLARLVIPKGTGAVKAKAMVAQHIRRVRGER